MRRTSRKVWRLAACTITIALFAACSTPPLTSPQNGVLTQPQASAVAEVVATDAASLVGGATLDAATGMPFALAPMPGAPALAPSSATCTPTRSPSPATTDRAFRTRSNAFTRSVTNSTGTTRSVVENGVRPVVPKANQVHLAG